MDGEFSMATILAVNLVDEWFANFPETVVTDAALDELVKRIAAAVNPPIWGEPLPKLPPSVGKARHT